MSPSSGRDVTSARRTALILVVVTAVCAIAASRLPSGEVGHAAGIPVASSRVSVFKPAGLPPVCTSQTVVAAADAWINEQQGTTNYGTGAVLNVTSRNGRTARTLLQFTLPAAPTGCTLSSATLRVYNATPAAGRTIAAYRAATAWTEAGVTWDTAPATAGTAVNVTSVAAAGYLQWTVTTHVQSLYSGSNFGFILRDSNEVGTTVFTQAFDSRTATNKPELVLQWG